MIVKYIEKLSSISYLHVMWSYLTSYDILTDNPQRNKINTQESRTFFFGVLHEILHLLLIEKQSQLINHLTFKY